MKLSAIPRLKLRRKTVPETLCPLISDLESTIQLIPRHEILRSGRDLVTSVLFAIQNISVWVKTNSANTNEVRDCQVSFDTYFIFVIFVDWITGLVS